MEQLDPLARGGTWLTRLAPCYINCSLGKEIQQQRLHMILFFTQHHISQRSDTIFSCVSSTPTKKKKKETLQLMTVIKHCQEFEMCHLQGEIWRGPCLPHNFGAGTGPPSLRTQCLSLLTLKEFRFQYEKTIFLDLFFFVPEERDNPLNQLFIMKKNWETLSADAEGLDHLHCTGHEIYEISFYFLSATIS